MSKGGRDKTNVDSRELERQKGGKWTTWGTKKEKNTKTKRVEEQYRGEGGDMSLANHGVWGKTRTYESKGNSEKEGGLKGCAC